MKKLKENIIFLIILLPFFAVGNHPVYDIIFITFLILLFLTHFIYKKIKKDDKSEATIEDIEYMITHVENDQEISEKEKTELINELDNIKKEMDINSHNKLEINENT
ncbi:hypothetical protein LNTAR_19192 [Lentisphaera araneosa HTCC2155]|uniref:Uncharacterized protein n=1 Tax=Lentisphaera araneosa HTCC2155 TaxID=313628 RepID=A6DQQ4_9BACT|nr:hypothetical protein [Lentisphaera araneosa]EDM25954.1 hypothetical protein LNTAR_19192 [Lentisphaera araneosa HTCC2155]